MSVQPVSDERLGKAIRELWEECGQGIFIPPRGRYNKLIIAVLDTSLTEEEYTLLDEMIAEAGSLPKEQKGIDLLHPCK